MKAPRVTTASIVRASTDMNPQHIRYPAPAALADEDDLPTEARQPSEAPSVASPKANVLVMGEINTGKTRSLMTLLPEYTDELGKIHKGAGLETFIISLEPGLDATLGPNLCNAGVPSAPADADGKEIDEPEGFAAIGSHSPSAPKAHWHYLPPRAADWNDIRNFAKLANSLNTEQLVRIDDPRRNRYTEFLDLFSICNDFVCHGCGTSFGDVSEWDASRAIALDSLTGLTTIARTCFCGASPFLSLPKIGGIQGLIEAFLDLFWGNTRCTAILTAHIEREISPLTGMSQLALSTIGQKLAPKLTKKPDEGLLAQREGRRYTWSNIEPQMELKRRRLPASAELPPDFSLLFKAT